MLEATVFPVKATNKQLTWSSSDPDVVEVLDGMLLALGIGKADVVVRTADGGKTASCKVVVVAEEANDDNDNEEEGDDNQNDDSDQDDGDGYDENLNPKGKVPDADDPGVYLGLSVNWAEHNLGAEDKEDVGGYYGWGDVTGSYYSSDLSYYPSVIPPENISGTKYDIVTQKWGNGWRMPTKAEWEELVESCYIQDDGTGWVVESVYLVNEIFIPRSKVRIERDLNNMNAYWTGDLGKENSDMAYCFLPGKESQKAISMLKRSYGASIRPVKDIVYKCDPTDLSYIIDGVEYNMVYVEGNDEIESFYIMQTELPVDSYIQIGDYIGCIDSSSDGIVSKNEWTRFINTLSITTQIPFRLPTVQEWLYAAKGGNKSMNYKYSGSNSADEVAWHKGNSDSRSHAIAQKKPNELGLYDMSGNFEEICIDGMSNRYNVDGDTYGGSWKDDASKCTATSWKKGISSGADADRIVADNGKTYNNKNAMDGRYITVRLVYSLK